MDAPRLLTRIAGTVLRTRALVRAPIWLYRHGLGVLFGHRLLMLRHTGRRSGLARYVVLEVVDRPRPGRYLVVAGFGMRAQWLRNVLAEPRVAVSVGRLREHPARAHLLGQDDTATALATYAAAHPRTWAQLSRTMEHTLGADLRELPMVALDLD